MRAVCTTFTMSPQLPSKVAVLVQRCWAGDPKLRPSAAECNDALRSRDDPGQPSVKSGHGRVQHV